MKSGPANRVASALRYSAALAFFVAWGCSDDDAARHGEAESSPAHADAGAAGKPAKAAAPSASGEVNEPKQNATPGTNDCASGKFESTFAAIQEVIFEQGSCTSSACHGEAALGGLDLRADVSYDNLFQVKSKNGSLLRLSPGVPGESLLYNKLRAATEPGSSVAVPGSPMPIGRAPLSAEHLEVVRRWIEVGAPRTGSIGDSVTGRSDKLAALLGTCLPEASPIDIVALPPPAADEGVQLVMAPFKLAGGKEVDVCFAQYYDLSDVVPKELQDPERGVFFVNGQRVRQDPNSHHLTLIHPALGAESVRDPSFGKWSCRGGDNAGRDCDPLKAAACGAGLCASEVQNKAACIGYGPGGRSSSPFDRNAVATAQSAQYYRAPREGVYESFPIRGIMYWNSHAFNLTEQETELNVWVNLLYAHDRKDEIKTVAITSSLSIAAGTPPFTTKNYCAKWTAPQNARLYQLGSHTHKRGRNFTVDKSDGARIYTSAIYSDPIEQLFDPPLVFDSPDAAQRTLTYCADFNNGVTEDGQPDVDLVTRLSRMPDRTTCTPVACVRGKVGAPCQGAMDNAACDSSQGAGDGKCDACAITAGQTTENEMFALSPSIVVPNNASK